MLPLMNGAVSLLLLILSSFTLIQDTLAEGRVVCYYTNWSVYRPGTAKYNPQNINPYLCTHLIYAFGGFTKDNQMKPFDKYQDIEQGGYAKFTGLKTYNKQLKTMIAIGGWNEASSRFSPLVASAERRQQFIKNILKFLRQNHFDGIDLDWEYPAHREGGKSQDRENYAQFVQEMRAEFERESQKTGRTRLLITMAVPAGIEYIDKGYDIPKLNKYLDWFNVLTYDFHSSDEPSVNHHAPLYSLEEESEYNYDAELNIDYSIKYYLKAGADRDKLVLGIPTYGRSYTLINEESTEIGAPAEAPGEQGDATREKGYLAYYEICQNIKDDPEWTVVQPNPNVMGPYAYRRNQWVGYDDEAIVRKKAAYAVDHGLGGIMFWAIDNDDFRGTCTGKPYPLIEAAKDEMLSLLGLGINEVSKPGPPKKPVRSRSRESSSAKNRISGVSEEKPSSIRNSISRNRKTSTTSTTTTTTPATTTIKLTEAEGSSLYIGGRTTTPAPPTTPDPGADFKCEEEGFFQHPRDCKKYYWCLDSGPSGLGIVAHQFTCPSGLYFNPAADSCDFARNVPCKTKKSTTASPATSPATTSTTTLRTTESPLPYKNSFYRTTTPKITTVKTTKSTTTTTTTPKYETDYEYEDSDDEIGTIGRDPEAEEDPKVLKELIQLIRKVGGIDELEKHLLRKEDGTISFKQGEGSTNNPTTPATISKSLYDKVLSRPNTFNSFRNRFTSSSLFRKNTQEKENNSNEDLKEDDVNVNPTEQTGSKYSSVLRNARPRPQNDGLDKLPEFDAFLKEKKQYVNISRNRPKNTQEQQVESQEESKAEKQDEEGEEEYDDEEEKQIIKTTQRTSSVRPSYASIRRTKPTLASDTEEVTPAQKTTKTPDNKSEKSYSPLNRRRGTTTTTTTTEKSRYNNVERNRFSPTSTTESALDIEKYLDEEETNENDEQQENANDVINTTPATPSTTLIHIFTLFDDMSTTAKPLTTATQKSAAGKPRLLSEQPKHKVVEINRIVEITAKEDKVRRKSKKHPDVLEPVGTSSLKVVSLPHLEQLGEISVVKYVHLVDGSDIEIDGHSTVADYTPTEPSRPRNSAPVRNSLPYGYPNYVQAYATERSQAYEVLTQRYGKALIPEVIREAVETSTIPLEGLFDHTRKAKQLNSFVDDTLDGFDTTEQPVEEVSTTPSTTTTTTTIKPTTQFPKYVRPIVPLLRPESNESSPIVISLSNLDQQQIATNTPYNTNIITRRPVLSVRRRIINSPETTTIQNHHLHHNELTTTEHELINKYNRHRTSSPSPLLTTMKQQALANNKFKSLSIVTSPTTSVTDNLQRANTSNAKYASSIVRRRFQTRRLPATIKTIATTTKPITKTVTEETEELRTTQNPLFKRRYNTGATHFPIIPTTSTLNQEIYSTSYPIKASDDGADQVAKSSIHAGFFNQLRKSAELRQEQNQAKDEKKITDDITRRIDTNVSVVTNKSSVDNKKEAENGFNAKSRTLKPKDKYRESFNRLRNKVMKPQFKTQTVPRTSAAEVDFEYYDDDNISLFGTTRNQQLKVILHGPGVIECLDQGNFPHPLSCRKFISCAKYETGGVVGWEYTCPKGTSYDPVGGMCNWAVLGCKN